MIVAKGKMFVSVFYTNGQEIRFNADLLKTVECTNKNFYLRIIKDDYLVAEFEKYCRICNRQKGAFL